LGLGRCDKDRHGVAQLHDVVDKDFDVIGAGGFELDLGEDRNVGGVEGGILEHEFDFAFAQDRRLVWPNESHGLGELADAGGPAVEEVEFEGNDGKLGHADEIYDADEEEIAGDFLAYFLAEEGALEVGKDAGGLHGRKAKG
jgi:hypothetical protein